MSDPLEAVLLFYGPVIAIGLVVYKLATWGKGSKMAKPSDMPKKITSGKERLQQKFNAK